jgi:hypothetical protein
MVNVQESSLLMLLDLHGLILTYKKKYPDSEIIDDEINSMTQEHIKNVERLSEKLELELLGQQRLDIEHERQETQALKDDFLGSL